MTTNEELDLKSDMCRNMGVRIFFAERALRSIALNHAEAARSGVTEALNALNGILPNSAPPAEPSGNTGELPVCATRFIGFPACCVLSNEERIFDHAFHGQYDLSGACLTCGKPEGHHQWTTSKPEPGGTFACPICGVTSVHQHTGSEIAEFMVRATCNGNRVVNMDGSAGDAGVSPQSTPTKQCPDCSAAQPECLDSPNGFHCSRSQHGEDHTNCTACCFCGLRCCEMCGRSGCNRGCFARGGAAPQEDNGIARGNAVGKPYVKLLEKLRAPIDFGGFDGFGPDPLHVSAADAIGALIVGLISQINISNDLRASLESAEKRLAQPATEQPRIWRVTWKDGHREGQSPFNTYKQAQSRARKAIRHEYNYARVQYSTDNGKTWVDEQAERGTKE